MVIRRVVGGRVFCNCWIMGMLFLICHWGRVRGVLCRENLVRRDRRDARFHCMLVLWSGVVFHFRAVDKSGWFYPYLFWVSRAGGMCLVVCEGYAVYCDAFSACDGVAV